MDHNSASPDDKKFFPFLVLFCLCFLVYSNTFDAAWQFDDYPNILQNPALHIESASPESLFNALFTPSGTSHVLRRPVSNLTFAVNWYFGEDDVTGYHLVNILIHIMTAFTLFSTILLLFRSPNLSQIYPDFKVAYFVAFLSSVLWAIHPIQTQAVTYIVQRMASLATVFYIIGIYLYLKGRIAFQKKFRYGFFFLCLVCYALAVGAKENAVTLPLALFLVEIIFFQNISDPKIRKFFIRGIFIAGMFFLFVAFIVFNVFLEREISSIFSGYEKRPFTLAERLMTQPRVLVFYLAQIFYPNADNLSLMHDFPFSTSLFAPWTTIPAIVFLLFLIVLSIYRADKWPSISFAILFYSLNHIIESTVIPLEMIYEHRNYLPSMFLFLPVSIGVWKSLEYFRSNSLMRMVFISAVVFILMVLGVSTYSRNEVWATEASLWQDTYEKAPGLARPAHNLGEIYSKAGQYEKAMELYMQALSGVDMRGDQKALTYYNMGTIFHRVSRLARAAEFYRKAIEIMPRYGEAWYNLTLVLIKMGRWDDAVESVHQLVSHHSGNNEYMTLRGAILLKMDKIDTAVSSFKKVLQTDPFNAQATFYLGIGYYVSEEYRKADQALVRAVGHSPDNIHAVLWLIENRIKMADRDLVDNAVQILFDRFSVNRLQNALRSSGSPLLIEMPASPSLYTLLGEILSEKAEKIQKTVQAE